MWYNKLMENKKEIYYKYFQEKILPQILPLERYRRKVILNVILFSLLFFALGLGFVYLFVVVMFNNILVPILFPIILFLTYVFFIKSIIIPIVFGKEFQEKLKTRILPLFLEPVANFTEWPENKNLETIIDSLLFYNFDTQKENFTYFGLYNNTNIIISDTKLMMPPKGAVRPTLFKGIIIQLEFDKSIDNHVILMSKNEKKANPYKQYNPHIQELNRYLYTFAKNPKNIKFITKDFWSVIKRLGEVYIAKGFDFSYRNNTVVIALRHKRPLRFGFLFRSLLKAKNYDDLIDRFIVIYDLIDILNNQN